MAAIPDQGLASQTLKATIGNMIIEVSPAGEDGFQARSEGRGWAWGRTPSEAIGALIQTNPICFGVKVAITVEASQRLKRIQDNHVKFLATLPQ